MRRGSSVFFLSSSTTSSYDGGGDRGLSGDSVSSGADGAAPSSSSDDGLSESATFAAFLYRGGLKMGPQPRRIFFLLPLLLKHYSNKGTTL